MQYFYQNDKNKPFVFTGIDKVEYDSLVRCFLSKPNVTSADRWLREARVNQSMSMSSRSTRTRKILNKVWQLWMMLD